MFYYKTVTWLKVAKCHSTWLWNSELLQDDIISNADLPHLCRPTTSLDSFILTRYFFNTATWLWGVLLTTTILYILITNLCTIFYLNFKTSNIQHINLVSICTYPFASATKHLFYFMDSLQVWVLQMETYMVPSLSKCNKPTQFKNMSFTIWNWHSPAKEKVDFPMKSH